MNNCATNLRAHVNRVVAEPLPYGWAAAGFLGAHPRGRLIRALRARGYWYWM